MMPRTHHPDVACAAAFQRVKPHGVPAPAASSGSQTSSFTALRPIYSNAVEPDGEEVSSKPSQHKSGGPANAALQHFRTKAVQDAQQHAAGALAQAQPMQVQLPLNLYLWHHVICPLLFRWTLQRIAQSGCWSSGNSTHVSFPLANASLLCMT